MLLTFGNCYEGRGIHLEDVVLFEKALQSLTVMNVEKHSEWIRLQSWPILARLRQTVLRIWICIELLDVWQSLDMKEQESWWLDDNDIGYHRVQVADHNGTQPEQQKYSNPVFCEVSKKLWFISCDANSDVMSQNATSIRDDNVTCEDVKTRGPIWRAKTLSYFKSSTRNMVKHSSWPIWALEQLAKV